MKSFKNLIVVLLAVISTSLIVNYSVTKKSKVNISKSFSVFILENEITDKSINTASTTTITNDNKRALKSTVTSRSGMRNLRTNLIEESAEPAVEEVQEEVKEETQEEIIPEKPTFQGVELEYSARYHVSSSPLSKSKGAIYYNGHKETYYSQRVLPGTGLKALNNNGRHVAEDGTVRDGDGYIAVACNYLPKGATVMTSLGPGKVYDRGGMQGKAIDIYVNW